VIESGAIPVVRLTEIFRQAAGSRIVTNAHRINGGEFPELPKGNEKSDFYFIQKEEPEEVLKVVLDLCAKNVPQAFGFDPIQDIQVLTPIHRGTVGATNLNVELQRLLNDSKSEMYRGGRILRRGDKVMQLVNDYDRDVYNGDLGRVAKVDHERHALTVDFDGREVEYDASDLDEIVPAHAISIHKSQGSEYPAVVIPLVTGHSMMLQRNLLYTGITRGKKLVVLVGSRQALRIAIKNNRPVARYTQLRRRLKEKSVLATAVQDNPRRT
jgi:exodeoxyribonuclease V alpha subunit